MPVCSSDLPRVPARRYVYDGVFEAQFFMLHDSNKRLLALGDIYPEAKELKKVTSQAAAQPLPSLFPAVADCQMWQMSASVWQEGRQAAACSCMLSDSTPTCPCQVIFLGPSLTLVA